jgi:hypothetical protein
MASFTVNSSRNFPPSPMQTHTNTRACASFIFGAIYIRGCTQKFPEQELPSATRCTCIASFVSQSSEFCRHNFCVVSQRVFIVVHFFIDSVRKLLDTPSYVVSSYLVAKNSNPTCSTVTCVGPNYVDLKNFLSHRTAMV